MSGSIKDSEFDETWTPPPATRDDYTFTWKPPWRKFNIRVCLPSGTFDKEPEYLAPWKMQFLKEHRLQKLQQCIHNITTFKVTCIKFSDELLEIEVKSHTTVDVPREIETVITNEFDIIMKTVQKYSFTTKLAQEIFQKALKDHTVNLVCDDANIFVIGDSTNKDFINMKIGELNSVIVKRELPLREQWKFIAVIKFQLIDELARKFPDVVTTVFEDKLCVYIHGKNETVHEAVQEMNKLLSNLHFVKLECDPLVLKLLECAEAARLFNEELEKERLTVGWVVANVQLCIFSQFPLQQDTLKSIIYENFLSVGFAKSNLDKQISSSKSFREANINKLMIQRKNGERIIVTSTRKIIQELLHQEKMSQITTNNTKEVQVDIRDDELMQLTDKTKKLEELCKRKEHDRLQLEMKMQLDATTFGNKILQLEQTVSKLKEQLITADENYEREKKDKILLETKMKQEVGVVKHQNSQLQLSVLAPEEQIMGQEKSTEKFFEKSELPFSRCISVENSVTAMMANDTRQSKNVSMDVNEESENLDFDTSIKNKKIQKSETNYLELCRDDYAEQRRMPEFLIDTQPFALNSNFSQSIRISRDSLVIKSEDKIVDKCLRFPKLTCDVLANEYEVSQFPAVTDNFLLVTTKEGLKIFVYPGNICYLNVDCIVNSSNEKMNHSSGVAHLIASKAGIQMEEECQRFIKKHGNLCQTSTCVTTAGKLSHYRYILHVCPPEWAKRSSIDEFVQELSEVVQYLLVQADKLNLKSVAIPAIGSGRRGGPQHVCFPAYLKGVTNFSCEHGGKSALKEIHFVDRDEQVVSQIEAAFLVNTPKDKGIKERLKKIPKKVLETVASMFWTDDSCGTLRSFQYANNVKLIICNGSLFTGFKHPHVSVAISDSYEDRAVVFTQNQNFNSKSSKHTQICINRAGCDFLKNYDLIKSLKKSVGKVYNTFGDVFLNFGYVLFAIMPERSQPALVKNSQEQAEFFKYINKCFSNCLKTADKLKIKHLCLPVLVEDFYDSPETWLLETCLSSVFAEMNNFTAGRKNQHELLVHITTPKDSKLQQIITANFG